MKPIALSGHSRALTQIKYNADGDILFTVAKDNAPSAWWTHNGERIGTYDGHNGAVWTVDVRYDTKYLITGSADNSAKIWDVETSECLATLETKSPVRTVGWSYSGDKFFYSTDQAMGQKCELRLFVLADVLAAVEAGEEPTPYVAVPCKTSKVTSAVWGPLDESVITGHDNGDLVKWEASAGKMMHYTREHNKKINDIQYNSDASMFVTASADNYAKIFATEDFTVIKTFRTERPVNSASISPIRDHVVMGGGQDAMSVTTTSTKVGKFDAAFYHLVYEEELGRVKGHFGPINTLAFNPSGKQYTSGGEDGYVRIHNFDDSYFEFEFEVGAH